MDLIEEVKRLGFINGKIKFGQYEYKIQLINNRQYDKYLKLIKEKEGLEDSKGFEALQYILGECLFREKKRLFRKPKKIFDFNILEYPVVMTDKFIRDIFLILLDKDFFYRLLKEEVDIEK